MWLRLYQLDMDGIVDIQDWDGLQKLAEFSPELVIVSAGFDAHGADPLAGLEVSEQGYRAVRIQTGVPGLKSIYGIASNATFEANEGVRYDHEPAQRGAFPAEEDWDTRYYLRHVPTVFEAVRKTHGCSLSVVIWIVLGIVEM